MDKPAIVRAWCEQRIGCPYIYGGTGQPCTPAYREARMAQYPAYAEKIKRNCPRLMGKEDKCADCKWCDPETGIGKEAYDCAQFSRRAMEAVGIKMVSGANSQWQKTKWAKHGDLADLPNDLFDKVFLVFRYDADKGGMGHVGICQGDGYVIHAKGHDYGVVRQKLSDVKFTHWGVPYGLYTEEPIVNHPTLRKGDSGEEVRELQHDLYMLSYLRNDEVDGEFGAKTEEAVKKFQREHSLKVDGVCGPNTWAALDREMAHDPDSGNVNKPEDDAIGNGNDAIEQPETDVVIIPRSDWNAICAAVSVLTQAVQKINGGDFVG